MRGFFRRRVFEQVGSFALEFMPASDREFLLRCSLAGLHNQAIDQVIHEYVLHGGSTTIRADRSHWAKMARVHLDIAERYVGHNDLALTDKKALSKFHSKNALIGFFGSLGAGHPAQAMWFVKEGCRRNVLWPLQTFSHLAEWAARKRT